jgi:transcriptional regulator
MTKMSDEAELAEILADAPVLTDRQAEAYALRARGLTHREIEEEMGLGQTKEGRNAQTYLSRADNRIRRARGFLEIIDLIEREGWEEDRVEELLKQDSKP